MMNVYRASYSENSLKAMSDKLLEKHLHESYDTICGVTISNLVSADEAQKYYSAAKAIKAIAETFNIDTGEW